MMKIKKINFIIIFTIIKIKNLIKKKYFFIKKKNFVMQIEVHTIVISIDNSQGKMLYISYNHL